MNGKLPSAMRIAHKLPRIYESSGEAWFYVSPKGLEIFVAIDKDVAATLSFKISRAKMERALEVIAKEQS